MKARLFTDGGARGNPGPAASAFVLEAPDGTVLDARGDAIGVATNNVAEYRGLLAALRYALDHGITNLTVRSDSLLLVCQMRGEYKVKNPGLQTLHAEARRLVWQLGRVRFEHVRREFNTHADRLANDAMDSRASEGGRQEAGSVSRARTNGRQEPDDDTLLR